MGFMWFEAGASPISNGTDIYRTRTYAFPLAEGYEPDENIILGKKAYCRIAGVPPADLLGEALQSQKSQASLVFMRLQSARASPGARGTFSHDNRIAGVPPADLFGGGFTKPKKSSFACFYAPPVCSCKPGILLAHKKSPPNRWAFLAL